MFQSNKEYLEFLKQSGVHSFLQETPNNLFEDKQKQTPHAEDKAIKSLDEITEIKDLIPLILNHNSPLRKNTKNMALFSIIGSLSGPDGITRWFPNRILESTTTKDKSLATLVFWNPSSSRITLAPFSQAL